MEQAVTLYESYDEYQRLREQVKADYRAMIAEGLDIARDKMHSWFEYHEGPNLGVQGHWACEGKNFWLKFTKNTRPEWCELMSECLVHELEMVCKTAIRIYTQTSRKRWTNQRIHETLLVLILDTACAFIQPKVVPNHMTLWQDEHIDYDEETDKMVPIPAGSRQA